MRLSKAIKKIAIKKSAIKKSAIKKSAKPQAAVTKKRAKLNHAGIHAYGPVTTTAADWPAVV